MASPRRDERDLPILDELGEQLRRAAKRQEARRGEEAGNRPARRRQGPRWLWPALAAGVLIVALLPALPALILSDGDGGDSSAGREAATTAAQQAPVLASGRSPEAGWEVVSLGAGCVALLVEGEPVVRTGCEGGGGGDGDSAAAQSAVGAGPLSDVVVISGRRDGFVIGRIAEPGARVRVQVGARDPVAAVVAPVPPDGDGGGGTADVFVATFGDPIGGAERVEVTALDDDGRVLARTDSVRRR